MHGLWTGQCFVFHGHHRGTRRIGVLSRSEGTSSASRRRVAIHAMKSRRNYRHLLTDLAHIVVVCPR